ncbi:unnamed protein product, partial [Prunus brigantina]
SLSLSPQQRRPQPSLAAGMEFSSCSSLRPSPPLGEGSFGVVWKALHKVTGEIVAIKQLKNEESRLTSWEEFLQMAEVESLSQLKNHLNIVNLKQAFMEVDGTASLVFEFMEGNVIHCSFGNYNWIFALSLAFNLTNLKSRGYPYEELGGQEKSRTIQEKGNSKLDF